MKTTSKPAPKPAPKGGTPAHPLVGKTVTGDVTADKNVGRKARRLRGVVTAYDSTCICIDKTWVWTTSIVNLKETK